MALRDLAGLGALQDALGETNTHLVAVLNELRETNAQRLDQIATELRDLNSKIDRLVIALEKE
jgi:hypothetical protein